MTSNKKALIIHITKGNAQDLKTRLHEQGLFQQYYDGDESTFSLTQGVISTRYYYYSIPHSEVLGMLRHLRTVGTGHTYKIKINPDGRGNHAFD